MGVTTSPALGDVFTRCHHVWPHDSKLLEQALLILYLPCFCFPPFPLIMLLILLPPSKFLKVSDAQSSWRDWNVTRAEKGSGVILPGEQRREDSNRKVGEVKWWKLLPGNYWKDRDWYDSRFKGLGLLRLQSWEWYQDRNEGCCLLTEKSCWDDMWSCCRSAFFPSVLPSSSFLTARLPSFFSSAERNREWESPCEQGRSKWVNRSAKPSQTSVSCLKHSPASLVGHALMLWFNCILVATNWVWSGCPVR